jgi:sugar O-acyltransferase (sialic acid O-acetyltransferase NeuD family)
MSDEVLGIFGARGHGRDTLLFAADNFAGRIVFVDDDLSVKDWHGIPVLSLQAFIKLDAASRSIAVAIADNQARRSVWKRVVSAGIPLVPIIARSAIVWHRSEFGAGALISPHVVISTGVRAGRGLIANTMAAIAHDCVLGDFVTIGPGAKCNGCVHIGDDVLIGAGALIKQGTVEQPRKIGSGAIIGMGAVVTRDVADNETVAGNPARQIPRNP